jgi:rare lipoprotein A
MEVQGMEIRKGILFGSLTLSLGALAFPALADTAQTGIASYYWQGKGTASGERFNPGAMTAAHRSLPFNTKVRVTNLRNGQSVIVRINDRGPFVRGRIIDVSRAAAGQLGFTGHGLTKVSMTVVGSDAPVALAEAETVTDRTKPTRSAKQAAKPTQTAADAAAQDTKAAPSAPLDNGWTLVTQETIEQAAASRAKSRTAQNTRVSSAEDPVN